MTARVAACVHVSLRTTEAVDACYDRLNRSTIAT